MRLSDLDSGRTLVLGFGREGRALEAALQQRFPEADVEVFCDRPPDPPPRRWPVRSGMLAGIRETPDRVLRSPGFPVDHPQLQDWRQAGIPVTCISSLWFGENPTARVIAVTGSKGKSTTASLIAHLLSATGRRVALAGNIGLPLLDLPAREHDWYVVELSSYQLADLVGHATIGVITRLFPEHQDWHGDSRGDSRNYYRAKLRLLELTAGNPVWINGADPVLRAAVQDAPAVVEVNGNGIFRADRDGIWRAGERLVPAAASPLPGRHNLDNLALALAVVESVHGSCLQALDSLSSFQPLPHRLQKISGPGSGGWINDSIATTPYATLAALEALPVSPVLICGGLERDADWHEVAQYCAGRPLAGLVTLPDNGPAVGRILAKAGAVAPDRLCDASDMEQAVRRAHELAGGCVPVLLSPGAPSFPHYRDFEQRGKCFIEAVARLKG
ncbi:MAG: UDP-N-acetylmuramoyl-L-alanine--D-glutamate ligase [Wenzhouxiangellaceae bacterium]